MLTTYDISLKRNAVPGVKKTFTASTSAVELNVQIPFYPPLQSHARHHAKSSGQRCSHILRLKEHIWCGCRSCYDSRMKYIKAIWNNHYVTGVLIILFFCINLIYLGLEFGLTKSDWSGWVQAVGALIGIAVAIAVPMHQREVERRERVQAGKNIEAIQAKHIADIADELLDYVENAAAWSNSGRPNPQGHLPELLGRITSLRSQVTRFTLNMLLKEINDAAWRVQNYANLMTTAPKPFPERAYVYQEFMTELKSTKINAHTTEITFRHYAKMA